MLYEHFSTHPDLKDLDQTLILQDFLIHQGINLDAAVVFEFKARQNGFIVLNVSRILTSMPNPPDTLEYHKDLSALLEKNEVELWKWFSGDIFTSEAYEAQRLYLLKNSYRLDDEAHAELYSQSRTVAERLGLDLPVTLYQAMNSDLRNAGLIFQPDAVHILFSGDLFTSLSETELTFILGHEMAHHLHNTRQNSRFGTADRLLDWICGEPGSAAAHVHSFRLSRLYQEIFLSLIHI